MHDSVGDVLVVLLSVRLEVNVIRQCPRLVDEVKNKGRQYAASTHIVMPLSPALLHRRRCQYQWCVTGPQHRHPMNRYQSGAYTPLVTHRLGLNGGTPALSPSPADADRDSGTGSKRTDGEAGPCRFVAHFALLAGDCMTAGARGTTSAERQQSRPTKRIRKTAKMWRRQARILPSGGLAT